MVSFSHDKNVKIQPIVQVDAEMYGDLDSKITGEIYAELLKHGIKTNRIARPDSLESALKIYSQLDLLIGMRMHSNILSAVQGVPFIAVAYEHKTKGISKYVGLERYCLDYEKVNSDNLSKLLVKAWDNKMKLGDSVKNYIRRIQSEENIRWKNLLNFNV